MTKRLPLCAICGRSLHFPKCTFRCVLDFKGWLYQPSIGWCDQHPGPNEEFIWLTAPERTKDELQAKLLEISERGAGRRVMNV